MAKIAARNLHTKHGETLDRTRRPHEQPQTPGAFGENPQKQIDRAQPANGKVAGKRDEHIRIICPKIEEVIVPIEAFEGVPLIMQKMSQKVIEQVRAKHMGKAAGPRAVKNPEENFRNSMHLMPGAKVTDKKPDIGFPASGFRRAMLAAAKAKWTGVSGADAAASVFVIADGGKLVQIKYDRVEMGEDALKNDNGVMDLRYRPYLYGWSALVRIQFDSGILTVEKVINLMHRAGFSVGIGEDAPRAKGTNGRWRVLDAAK